MVYHPRTVFQIKNVLNLIHCFIAIGVKCRQVKFRVKPIQNKYPRQSQLLKNLLIRFALLRFLGKRKTKIPSGYLLIQKNHLHYLTQRHPIDALALESRSELQDTFIIAYYSHKTNNFFKSPFKIMLLYSSLYGRWGKYFCSLIEPTFIAFCCGRRDSANIRY